MLTITIETNNAAFYGPDGSCADPCPELADILRKLANRIQNLNGVSNFYFPLSDSNGNQVGVAELSS